MGEKSEIKKKLILDKARTVFAEKGFKNVTMKDIVDACEISRGGLYLYFSSTDELFLSVLASETDEDDEETITAALTGTATAGDMLALFFHRPSYGYLPPMTGDHSNERGNFPCKVSRFLWHRD